MHVLRRIDPTPQQIQADLDEVFRRAYQSRFPDRAPPNASITWGKFQKRTAQPEGTFTQRISLGWMDGELRFRFAWWTDAIGQRHWHIEGHFNQFGTPPGEALAARNWGPALSLEEHPLPFMVPPLTFFWQGHGANRRPLLVCRCGFAGTPESLGWMGECCAPCFDREQEGLPPIGLPPFRADLGVVDNFALAPDGRLVTVRWGRQEGDEVVFRAWKPPYAGKPIWQRDWLEDWGRGLGCGPRHVAVLVQLNLMLLDLDDGRTCGSWSAGHMEGWMSLAFAGLEGERLLALSSGWFQGWDVSAGRGLGHRLFQTGTSADGYVLAVSPLGQRALLSGLTIRDTATGSVLERLAFDERIVVAATFGPDGAVFVEGVLEGQLEDPSKRLARARWSADASSTEPGLWETLVGMPSRRPEAVSYPEAVAGILAVSPDGSTLLAVSGEDLDSLTRLSFLDARALREVARLELAGCFILQAAFSPDGHSLLVLTDHGLAVYPWRELAGLR
jgi:hypothetical protein